MHALDWLRVGASVTYTNAKFTEADSRLFGNTVTYGPFGDVPEYSGSIYADAIWRLPDDKGSLSYHVDVYGQSSFYFSNLGGTIQPGTEAAVVHAAEHAAGLGRDVRQRGSRSACTARISPTSCITPAARRARRTSRSSPLAFGMPRTYGIAIRTDF